jgi:hypothetical protein
MQKVRCETQALSLHSCLGRMGTSSACPGPLPLLLFLWYPGGLKSHVNTVFLNLEDLSHCPEPIPLKRFQRHWSCCLSTPIRLSPDLTPTSNSQLCPIWPFFQGCPKMGVLA